MRAYTFHGADDTSDPFYSALLRQDVTQEPPSGGRDKPGSDGD
jgi:hypothetical protein